MDLSFVKMKPRKMNVWVILSVLSQEGYTVDFTVCVCVCVSLHVYALYICMYSGTSVLQHSL